MSGPHPGRRSPAYALAGAGTVQSGLHDAHRFIRRLSAHSRDYNLSHGGKRQLAELAAADTPPGLDIGGPHRPASTSTSSTNLFNSLVGDVTSLFGGLGAGGHARTSTSTPLPTSSSVTATDTAASTTGVTTLDSCSMTCLNAAFGTTCTDLTCYCGSSARLRSTAECVATGCSSSSTNNLLTFVGGQCSAAASASLASDLADLSSTSASTSSTSSTRSSSSTSTTASSTTSSTTSTSATLSRTPIVMSPPSAASAQISSSASSTSTSSHSGSSLSTGAVAGISIAGAIALVFVGVCAFLTRRQLLGRTSKGKKFLRNTPPGGWVGNDSSEALHIAGGIGGGEQYGSTGLSRNGTTASGTSRTMQNASGFRPASLVSSNNVAGVGTRMSALPPLPPVPKHYANDRAMTSTDTSPLDPFQPQSFAAQQQQQFYSTYPQAGYNTIATGNMLSPTSPSAKAAARASYTLPSVLLARQQAQKRSSTLLPNSRMSSLQHYAHYPDVQNGMQSPMSQSSLIPNGRNGHSQASYIDYVVSPTLGPDGSCIQSPPSALMPGQQQEQRSMWSLRSREISPGVSPVSASASPSFLPASNQNSVMDLPGHGSLIDPRALSPAGVSPFSDSQAVGDSGSTAIARASSVIGQAITTGSTAATFAHSSVSAPTSIPGSQPSASQLLSRSGSGASGGGLKKLRLPEKVRSDSLASLASIMSPPGVTAVTAKTLNGKASLTISESDESREGEQKFPTTARNSSIYPVTPSTLFAPGTKDAPLPSPPLATPSSVPLPRSIPSSISSSKRLSRATISSPKSQERNLEENHESSLYGGLAYLEQHDDLDDPEKPPVLPHFAQSVRLSTASLNMLMGRVGDERTNTETR